MIILYWTLFIILTVIMLFFLYLYYVKKKYMIVLPFALIALFYFYSFYTISGATRLNLALMGHPIVAYTCEFIEEPLKIDGYTLKKPKAVLKESKKFGYIGCNDNFIVQYCKYFEFLG